MRDRILIVEDEPIIAIDLETLIQGCGYRVSGIANDFESARRVAPLADIAFIDVNLADGQTGPRIGQFLAHEYGVTVIFVTGDECAVAAGVSGVLGYILKPMNAEKIKGALDYVSKHRLGHRLPPPPGLRLFEVKPLGHGSLSVF